jgi:hypothetical protein
VSSLDAYLLFLKFVKLIQFHSEQRDVEYPKFVKVAPTGRPGRPRKTINLDFLREATSAGRQITLTKLARALNVHPNTLRLYMKQHGVLRNYSAISNDSLDSIVRAFKLRKPESGLRYTVGHLRNQNLRVQRRRVIASMQRVDGLGRMIRSRNMVHRRKYKVKRPNALWHVDGHHKLIRWGIVIHGIVDGFCRTVGCLFKCFSLISLTSDSDYRHARKYQQLR